MRFIIPFFIIFFIISSCSTPEKRPDGQMLMDANKRIETGIKEYKKQSFLGAERNFYWALDSYILLDNREGQVSAFLSLGTLYLTQDKMKEAFSMFTKALEISVELNNRLLRIDALSSLAGLYLLTEELSKAKEAISQGLKLAKKEGGRRKATLLNHLGNLNIKEGNPINAEKIIRESLSLNEDIDNKEGMSANYFNLGLVNLDKGDHKQAGSFFKKALTLDKYLEKPAMIARDLEKLGDIAEIVEQKKEALLYYERSLLIYQQLKDDKGLRRLSRKINDIKKQN